MGGVFDFLTVKNRESALQALRDVWMRGGVDISPPVIRLLTRWDRAGGHDINDADYGRNVWDRVIIAGIWPIELLASGLGSLLIVAILAAKRLNRDLLRFRGEPWAQGFANLSLVVVFGLAILGLMLLAGYVRQMVSRVWRASDKRGRIVIAISAAAVTLLAWIINYLQQGFPNLVVGNKRIDWLLSILWRGLGYLSVAIMALAAVVAFLMLIATQGPAEAPRTWLKMFGKMLHDLAGLTVRRIAQGGLRTCCWVIGWLVAVACLIELARSASLSLTPSMAALLLALITAGLAWLTWPALPTIVAVAGILLTVVLAGISGTFIPAVLMLGWVICLWRTIGLRAARRLPGYISQSCNGC